MAALRVVGSTVIVRELSNDTGKSAAYYINQIPGTLTLPDGKFHSVAENNSLV